MLGFARFLTLSLTVTMVVSSAALASEQEVVNALSSRQCAYGSSNLADLEELAGGKDALIPILLKYRDKETPPFIGIRSEKLLLNYTDEAEVVTALEQDVNNPNLFGLARIVSIHLDEVSDSEARKRLAKVVAERAKRESRFARYGQLLLKSKDSEVQRIAREELE
jgi:hypothetical protein